MSPLGSERMENIFILPLKNFKALHFAFKHYILYTR